ncbi:hypothetical protein GGR28_001311 [Lewinella aquimaris]|uniref:VCBS repeat protein n=1 Tax=Neolewinella aquimaris TaxID=1835722 RepID=A0A840E9H1_9BACT|nr:VCBS repeat-containing protein [Neolewinella aquimaris]MBB4078698.1 hypothetical protein [Neolewinella aquimaris]
MSNRLILSFGLLVLCVLLFGRCQRDTPPPHPGQLLATTYCASCHQLPTPDQLTREIWTDEVLPKMGAFYGIYESYPRRYFLENPDNAPYVDHLYPEQPVMDTADWHQIVDYFVGQAPDRLLGSKAPQDLLQLRLFRPVPIYDSTTTTAPYTTLLQFDTLHRHIITGGPGRGLRTFTADHNLLSTNPLTSTPSDLDVATGQVLLMGSLLPSDIPRGSLTDLAGTRVPAFPDSLARPVQMVQLDLDQNGRLETVVAEYGNMVGYLNSYELTEETGTYRKCTLQNQAGALRLRVADLDRDGHDDLLVLYAQGNESVIAYLSKPGTFERRELLSFPAVYGSSDLEVVDFDGDGDLDLLCTNGDNFDYQPIPKPYHGIRIYLNDGEGHFSEAYFYPMDGAYDLAVDDFDLDGDMDIAAIAYFIPPSLRATRSFVFLEQQDRGGSELSFTAASFVKESDQHYLTMAAGDVDADGDTDLLIGSFAAYLPDGLRGQPSTVTQAPVYIYLENLAR